MLGMLENVVAGANLFPDWGFINFEYGLFPLPACAPGVLGVEGSGVGSAVEDRERNSWRCCHDTASASPLPWMSSTNSYARACWAILLEGSTFCSSIISAILGNGKKVNIFK